MKFTNSIWINIKKLKTRTKKALFLIVPVGLLMALSVVVSSQVTNVQDAVNDSVFGTIEEQHTLIELEIEEDTSMESQMMKMFQGDTEEETYSSYDVEYISEIDGVESVNLLSSISLSNVVAEDLFEGKSFSLQDIVGMDSITASLYTEEDFEYTEGEAIPIILNASTFIYEYEDWSDGDVITIDMSSFDPSSGERPKMNATETEVIDYDKDDLIGQTFTISLGGLEGLATSTHERTDTGVTITKVTDEELEEQEADREELISEYWDYESISTKLEYEFVVVGVIEEEGTRTTYIPSDFADVVMEDLVQNQLDALIEEPSTEDLNSVYMGMTYDGSELSSGASNMFGQMMGRGMRDGMGMGSESTEEDTAMATIPGLVIEIDEDEEVIGIYDSATVYTESEKTSTALSIKVDNVLNRESVIDELNDSGYAYQDMSDLEVFAELEDTLNTISTVFIIAFIVLIAGIVVMTMSKLISESTKEIGIFRAIGFTKNDISILFILQALLYVFIGYVVGIAGGIGLNVLASSGMNMWFTNFIDTTISESYNVVNTVDSSVFMNISWESIITYSVLILIISLVVSFVPARQASSISPVEAIKSE